MILSSEAEQTAAERALMRWLITLIYVDRDKPAIMVVIRRELPRTTIVRPALWLGT